MATVNFYYRGKSEKGNLTIRLKHSTSIDYRISTKIVSLHKYWFKTNNKKRTLEEFSYLDADAKTHKAYLENIKEELLLRFKNDFNNGVAISKEWFINTIEEITNILSSKNEIINAQNEIDQKEQDRISSERDIYNKNLVTTAVNRVIEVEYFDKPNQIRIYNQLLTKIKGYQKAKKTTLKTKDITQDFINVFTAFLMKDLKHQISTARKHCKSLIHAIKYQKNAFPNEVELSEGEREIRYKKQSKSDNRQRRDEIVITLSFDELDRIDKTEVPTYLLNAKKVILFGCEVGLRVSDFNKLTQENIRKEGRLEYWNFWNKKTGIDVIIPINSRIKKFIDCYGMPKTEYNKTAEVLINREIKEVCELAEIDEYVRGRKSQSVTVNGKQTRRTVSMKYPKYEVITCHSLRRSFATNYSKVLELSDIRQITGHTSDTQLLEYINQNEDRSERTMRMLEKMNKNAQKLEHKPKLKVLKTVSNGN